MKFFIVGKKYPMRNGEAATFKKEFKHGYEFEYDGKILRTNFFGLASGPSNYDIISDTPIEDDYDLNENGNFKNTEKNREYLRKRTDLIVSENGTISQRLVAAPKRPRQFDVSKLKEPTEIIYRFHVSHGEMSDLDKCLLNTQELVEHAERKKVLEAWNSGTLEELLTTWVESPKGE